LPPVELERLRSIASDYREWTPKPGDGIFETLSEKDRCTKAMFEN